MALSKLRKLSKGFTLVELLVVIVIIGLVIVIACQNWHSNIYYNH